MGQLPEEKRSQPARAARWAALAVLLAANPGCTRERLASSERLSLASQPGPNATRTVVDDERGRQVPVVTVALEPLTRIPWGGGALPVVSPDGTKAATEARSTATWPERVGDPLAPAGFDTQIEAVSLDRATPGAPLSRLEGPWLLGRAATDRGFLVERPRPDGRRWIAMAGWSGGLEPIADDDWCNAHATVRPDGALAWSRRQPEGGDWELVVRVAGRQAVVRAPEGSGWVLPVFAGDGNGLFALRLDGNAVSLAWMPFGDDGLPAEDGGGAAGTSVPLTVRGGLSWAVRALSPVGGLNAAPPGSDRVSLWLPDAGRAALWAPGAEPELLPRGSMAALRVDEGNVLVTTADALLRHRLGSTGTDETLSTESWFACPPPEPGQPLVAFRVRSRTAEFAQLRLSITQ